MKTKNSLIYFEPAFIDLPVNEYCFPKISFVAKKGIVFEGFVTPPLEGVNIKATGLAQNLHTKFYGTTNKEGKYRIGPVDDVEFSIAASLDDYAFTHISKQDFSVVKVAMIAVGCKCGGFAKVIGRMGLVRQGVVQQGGVIKFSNLEPDLYSVTCVHPDYKFENAEVMLIAEKHVHLALRGKQTGTTIGG